MSAVEIERRGNVARVVMNRPESLNAMNAALMDELVEALGQLRADDSVRCVVLTGAGGSFSAGGDLKESRGRRQATLAAASPGAMLDAQVNDLQRRGGSSYHLLTMPKPTIAAMRGHAVGGALALALACDLRVISDTARLSFGFPSVGLSGDFGIGYLLQMLVGGARARELLLLDRRLDAQQALAAGLATEIVGDSELEDKSMALATKLAAGPTFAYGKIKENLYDAYGTDLTAFLRREAVNTRLTALSADSAEAGQAFAEKRVAHFKGE